METGRKGYCVEVYVGVVGETRWTATRERPTSGMQCYIKMEFYKSVDRINLEFINLKTLILRYFSFLIFETGPGV
jgi:hypothetical protein